MPKALKLVLFLALIPMVLWVHAEEYKAIEPTPKAYMHVWVETPTERSAKQIPFDDLDTCKQVSRRTELIRDALGNIIGSVTEQCYGYDGPSINLESASHSDQAGYR